MAMVVENGAQIAVDECPRSELPSPRDRALLLQHVHADTGGGSTRCTCERTLRVPLQSAEVLQGCSFVGFRRLQRLTRVFLATIM